MVSSPPQSRTWLKAALIGAFVIGLVVVILLASKRNNSAGGPDAGSTGFQPSASQPAGSQLSPSITTTSNPETLTRAPAQQLPPLLWGQAWIAGPLTGHYHEQAVSSKAIILPKGKQYRLFIDAPQAKFNCDLVFDAEGRPKSASACAIVKYDAMGEVQNDVHWWTPDVISFKCATKGEMEVCHGPYVLHFNVNENYPPEKRIMRIERKLTQAELLPAY